MGKPIFRLFNKYKLYHFLFFIFFIITSCDEKYVPLLEESEISTEYVQKSFVLNAEKSTLPISPDYLNQDLSSRVYIGTVDDDRMSYAIFEIQSDIMSKYGLCDDTTLDDEIESVDSILFRVVFDSPIINTYNNSYSLDPPNDEMINNFDFEDNIENDIAILNTNFKSYYSDNSGVVFNEDDLANHVPENIENTIELIKSDGNIISLTASTNYKLDLNLSDYIDIDNLCNQSLDKFSLELANKIIQNAPISLKSAKSAILSAQYNEGFVKERKQYINTLDSKDRDEGLLSFKEKRSPNWKNK